MEIEYKGANCVQIKTKKLDILIDPKISSVGLKDITAKNACVIATQPQFATQAPGGVVIDRPGEYEVANVSFNGLAVERMIDHDGSKQATVYRIATNELTIAVVGHCQAPFKEEQLEAIGVVDIAIVPVGGGGYTLNAEQAVQVTKQLNPKVVIPTHYADKDTKYEVPQDDLEQFTKALAVEVETDSKLKIKNGQLPEVLRVFELTRTA